MSSIGEARRELVSRILGGDGRASRAQRQAAFDDAVQSEPLRTLIHRVANEASRITDQDIASARGAGMSEDQIFELVVCAAVGEATRQYEAAMSALAEADGTGAGDAT